MYGNKAIATAAARALSELLRMGMAQPMFGPRADTIKEARKALERVIEEAGYDFRYGPSVGDPVGIFKPPAEDAPDERTIHA